MRRVAPARRKPILVLQHAGCETPGVYEDELIERRRARVEAARAGAVRWLTLVAGAG